MATVSSSKTIPNTLHSTSEPRDRFKILIPYLLIMLAQLPMLLLYARELWAQPHYQSFPFAIIVTAVLLFMRWPRHELSFRSSLLSDFLLIMGVGAWAAGVAFVTPWFAALSLLLVTTSLLLRVEDEETGRSLWYCALPLYVALMVPLHYDTIIISRLQALSAQFTSKLLDLSGLGHFLEGTVIEIPGGKQYGIEEACSGIVSFFTLLFVTTAFIAWKRRITTPPRVIAVGLVGLGLTMAAIEFVVSGFGYATLVGIVLILLGTVGFRSTLLLASAVFWALFMNTVRILAIPIADYHLGLDLSHGFLHGLLGYSVLLVGILMVLSTDQFLLFLFGPVDPATGTDAGSYGKPITRFWNGFLAGQRAGDGHSTSSKRSRVKPITQGERALVWGVTILAIALGLFSLKDVWQSWQHAGSVRFFGSNVITEFEKDDIPPILEGRTANWQLAENGYKLIDRERGSDLGKRSDRWQFLAPRCQPVASFDQPFPGWHELTTCYKNTGWKLVDRVRKTAKTEDGHSWPYIEATLEKPTGEKAFLLFSHFDATGEPVDAPARWGTLNSLLIRARNRLSNRIRGTLFDGSVYQTQVLIQSYNPIDDELKNEAREHYERFRETIRKRFKEKRAEAASE